jgi:hypothetical protein
MQSDTYYLENLRRIGLFPPGVKLPVNPRFFRKNAEGKPILLNGKPERDWNAIMCALRDMDKSTEHVEEHYRAALDRYIIRLGGLPDRPSFFTEPKIFAETHFTPTQITLIQGWLRAAVDPLHAKITALEEQVAVLRYGFITSEAAVGEDDDGNSPRWNYSS